MGLPTIIYYGKQDLRAQVLSAFFCKLDRCVLVAGGLPDLLNTVKTTPNPIVVISDDAPPPTLIRLAGAVIPDLARSSPHVFILYDGEWFDPKLPAVTVISGARQLTALIDHILAWPSVARIEPAKVSPSWKRRCAFLLPEDFEKLRNGTRELTDEQRLLNYSATLRDTIRTLVFESRELRRRARESHSSASSLRNFNAVERDKHRALIEQAIATVDRSRELQSWKAQAAPE